MKPVKPDASFHLIIAAEDLLLVSEALREGLSQADNLIAGYIGQGMECDLEYEERDALQRYIRKLGAAMDARKLNRRKEA